MEKIVMEAQKRNRIGKKVKQLRADGKLPAVIYGRELEGLPITLNLREVTRILRNVTSSTLVTLDVDGEEYLTLLRERQRDVLKGNWLHLDFLAVSRTEKIRASVSIVLEGEAPALKNFDALLVTSMDQVEVDALATDLPEFITVDVSGLEEIGNSIAVADLQLGDGVDVLNDPEDVLVVVSAQTAEIEEEVDEEGLEEDLEAGLSEPEVIEKGKAEEEDEE